MFGDILEHLRDPLGTTGKDGLRREGSGHLLNPEFGTYLRPSQAPLSEMGPKELWTLVDRTPPRFLTMKTDMRLIGDARLSIERMDFGPWIPLFRLRTFRSLQTLEHNVARAMTTLLASNFIIIARRPIGVT